MDQALLTCEDSGFTVRDPLLRDVLVAWLRPSALRRLHRRIAERAHIPASQRVRHWLGAGEPQLARAASLEASSQAISEGRYEHARPHLRQLTRLSNTPDAVPSDRLEVFERLGDVCGVLGRAQEAQAAFATASEIAQAHGLPDLERIEAKLLRAAGDTVISAPAASLVPYPAGTPEPVAASLGIERDTPPDPEVEERLTVAVRDADGGSDPDLRARLRLLLTSTVCVPRREFRAAHRWTREALSLTVDPALCGQLLTAAWLPGAILGNGSAVHEHLDHAAALAAKGGDSGAVAHLAALRCLVAHDMGSPDYEALRAEATAAGAFDDGADHLWMLVRIATERGQLAEAEAAERSQTSHPVAPVVRQLRDITSAALAMELGRPAQARERLIAVIDAADETGATLVVPEATARLVILEAPVDAASARERFELFEWAAAGDSWLPRENVFRLLARSAMRAADGRPDDAAGAAAAAADAAESRGLVLLAAQAHRFRALHLSAGNRRTESRLASATASRFYHAAGAAALVHRGEADSRRARSIPVQGRIPVQGGPERSYAAKRRTISI